MWNRGQQYRLLAVGPVFEEVGRGLYEGWLKTPPDVIDAVCQEIRESWLDHFLAVQERNSQRYPFAEQLDLNDVTHTGAFDRSVRTLARKGNKLYRQLFEHGDEGLQEIGTVLSRALRDREQVVSFHSDTLFAPWWLMHLPDDPRANVEAESAELRAQDFLSYGHLIEHNFSRAPASLRLQLNIGAKALVGLNVDSGLDAQFGIRVVTPLIGAVEMLANTTVRTTRPELAMAFRSGLVGEHVSLFACHANVSQNGSFREPYLELTDKDAVYASDFHSWLQDCGLPGNPLVFVSACQGGQMSSLFYPSFGLAMIASGASCLVGPQVDIPPLFATDFASRFFTKLLDGQDQTVGQVVHQLARQYLDEQRNPLGLAYASYRGTDARLIQDVSAA